jgi:hypothetical protein
MALVQSPADELNWQAPDNCFFCGYNLGYPYLYWMGSKAELGLHVECFHQLVTRLSLDIYKLQRQGRAEAPR